jgi:cell wall-associated NlpC family hydrolase
VEGKAVSVASGVARFVLLGSILASLLLATAAPVAAAGTELDRVIATATAQRGDRWVHYAKGPDKFDCVGFVFFSFDQNGLKERIGGYRGVKGYFKWFQSRGLAGLTNPLPGDLIVWGKFQHIGIYLGNGMAISALINPYGVKIHPVTGYIGMKVKAYLHTQIGR